MLLIQTNRKLLDLKGAKLKDEKQEDVLLGVVLSNVMSGKVSNPTLGWTLGKKFATQKEVQLKAEEVVFVKEEVRKCCDPGQWMSTVLGGQILMILDGDEDEEEAPKPKKK